MNAQKKLDEAAARIRELTLVRDAQRKELAHAARQVVELRAELDALKQAGKAAKNVLTSASRSAGEGRFSVDEKYLDKLCEELNNVAELLK